MSAVTVVIGGQYFSWNEGLKAGFWEFFGATLITGSAYMSLILCLAEMTATLPFSGGAYGFVRLALGPYLGFLTGCCEILGNSCYVSISVIPLGQMINNLANVSSSWEPLFWVLFFLSAWMVHFNHGRVFWAFNSILGSVSLIILLMYIFATIPHINFQKFAMQSSAKTSFFEELSLPTWFYIGSEMIPLAGSDCDKVVV